MNGLSIIPFSKKSSVLQGFGLSLGYTTFYLTLIVLIPLSAVILKTFELTTEQFWKTISDPRVLASFRLTFLTALIAALVNMVFGLMYAWVLVRYRFPGRKLMDGLVDLPFALPTAIAGIALTSLYVPNGWIGQYLDRLGIKVAYTPLGIIIALIFIGFPFVVRTVQPVLQDLSREIEESATTLGARPSQTFFRIIFPEILPALLTGFSLAFARGVGEYGSVVFISGNMPMKTEITPLLIITRLEQYQYAQATAIAVVMMIISFVLLFLINFLQKKVGNRSRQI